jgi:hypothetical protein
MECNNPPSPFVTLKRKWVSDTISRAPKRRRVNALNWIEYEECWQSEDRTFVYWAYLPIDMHGEITSWLSQTDLRMLCHVNRLEYGKFCHLNTHDPGDQLLQAIHDGSYQQYQYIACCYHELAYKDYRIILEAITYNRCTFISDFIKDRCDFGPFVELVEKYESFTTAWGVSMSYGHSCNFKEYIHSFTLRQLRYYCDFIARNGTFEMVNLILDIFDMQLCDDNAKGRILKGAMLYNYPLLQQITPAWGNILLDRTLSLDMCQKRRRNVLLTVLGSGNLLAIQYMMKHYNLEPSLADKGFITLPDDLGIKITRGYLEYTRSLKCSPSASAVLVHAITHNDFELLRFSLDVVKCSLRNLELLASHIRDISQEPMLDYLFSKKEYLHPNATPITRLKAGCSVFGTEYLLRKGLIIVPILRTASSRVRPEVLLYLHEHNFPVQDAAIINCVYRNDSAHLYSEMMALPSMVNYPISDNILARMCVNYGSRDIAKLLYLSGRCPLTSFINATIGLLSSRYSTDDAKSEDSRSGSCYGLCIILSLMRIRTIPYPNTIREDLSTIEVPSDYQCKLTMDKIMQLVCKED